MVDNQLRNHWSSNFYKTHVYFNDIISSLCLYSKYLYTCDNLNNLLSYKHWQYYFKTPDKLEPYTH